MPTSKSSRRSKRSEVKTKPKTVRIRETKVYEVRQPEEYVLEPTKRPLYERVPSLPTNALPPKRVYHRPLLYPYDPFEVPDLIHRTVFYCWRDQTTSPRFTQRLVDVHTRDGRNCTLEVRLSGFPGCSIVWSQDGRPLTRHPQPANVEVRQYGAEMSVLYIRNATAANEGLYACTAFSSAGNIRTAAFVRVDRNATDLLDSSSMRIRKFWWQDVAMRHEHERCSRVD